jgi:transcription antitermination factor NusA-like protein
LGLLEKVREQDYEESLDEEIAHDVLVRIEETVDLVSPTRDAIRINNAAIDAKITLVGDTKSTVSSMRTSTS